MSVLWLPGWYPNKLQPLIGDFIQRHARAVALYRAVQVIFLVRDKEGIITKSLLEENFVSGQLNEKIIYYYTRPLKLSLADKAISAIRYRRLAKKYAKQYIEEHGIPACTHLHVASKNAMLALWLKKKFKIPFIISEQWTAFLPEARPNFRQFDPWFAALWRKAIRRSSAVSVVSKYLGLGISTLLEKINFTIIPNVVDDQIFSPGIAKETGFSQFIHVSTLGYQKNPEAMLHAFAIVARSNPGFMLTIFGPQNNELRKLSNELRLNDKVNFHAEVQQPALAACMRSADALVLYSRYETFGCVLIEANACGIPVIVSDIPVFHENVKNGITGIFVPLNDPVKLAEVMYEIAKGERSFDSSEIEKWTKDHYSYEIVGKQFGKLYDISFGGKRR